MRLELERWVTVVEELFPRDRDPDSKSLDEAECAQGFCNMGIAIISSSSVI
jgi:hypothetical protein